MTPSGPRRASRRSLLWLLAVVPLVVAACGGPILANPPLPVRGPATPIPTATPRPDPQPIALPRDDGPHDRLTEWWYFTGHLRTADDRRFGFEAVIFRAERGDVPVTWASHLALTDETGGRFMYAQRSELGPQVDRSPRTADGVPKGFDLAIIGADPRDPATLERKPWTLTGGGRTASIVASLSPGEAVGAGAPFGLSLSLTDPGSPVLHDRDGFVAFGPAGGSYYYSRTRMTAKGTLYLDGRPSAVEGSAWFDHQWGDFISVGGGGWDWFAVNLDDQVGLAPGGYGGGSDLTLSLVRSADGSYPLVYGTHVSAPDERGVRTTKHLRPSDFTVAVTGRWTSPRTGATYPAGWRISVPSSGLIIDLTPTVPDQELDTRATTGVVYWEGSQHVSATWAGGVVSGEAYVELTGYAARPAGTAGGASPSP